jgi:hypothetical protein
MGTVSNPMQPTAIRHLTLVRKDVSRDMHASAAKDIYAPDDGLGCFRGFAVAMFCNLIFGLMIFAGWGLWHMLR